MAFASAGVVAREVPVFAVGAVRMGQSSQFDCSEVRKQLPSYLNETLDARTAEQMHWHFGRCKDCRMILRSAMETFRQFFPEKRTANPLHKSHAA